MLDLLAHLKTLCELDGPSGYEAPIRDAVRAAWEPYADSFEDGRLGDLIAYKRGSGPEPRRKIFLCAHMDEIGLIVKSIDRGFLRVTTLGGIDARTLPGKAVRVHGRRVLPGVVALPSLDERTDPALYPVFNQLWIDLGLPEEEVRALVRPGDMIALDVPLVELAGGRVAAKALDDRSCIAVLTGVLEALQGRAHTWDVIAVASTQEEVGVGGAALAAYQTAPDLAIALDVTFGLQAGVTAQMGGHALAGAVPVSLGANFHPALYDALLEAAARVEIATVPDPLPMHSGTDAWPIQIAHGGIPTALVNLPIRNMHTSVETVDLLDIRRLVRLLAEFISGLTPDFLDRMKWDDS